MAGSVAVATRKWIVAGMTTRLAALTDFADVHVSYAWPVGKKDRDKLFGTRMRSTHSPASLRAGRTYRDQEGEIDFVVLVESVGGDAEEADERAAAIGTELEEFIADNRTPDVAGVNWILVARDETTSAFNDRGTLSELTITVRYNARLT